jgi:hypothetical protein
MAVFADTALQERWLAQWGYADSQGFGVASSLGLGEFLSWDEADSVLQKHVEKFTTQEQADHDAINPESRGQTPEAVELLERRLAEQRPRGQEWGCQVESVTGHRYAFVIEDDGPRE